MAEHDEHHDEHHAKPRTRRKSEIVPTGDPAHEATSAREPSGALAFVERARDVLTVRRVYGDPIEKDGVTVIPAANVRGGGGGGSGESEGGKGSGGGFGVSASPAGAYVIRADGRVMWRPALDLNRTILMGQIVAIVFLLTVRSVVKAIAKRR